MATNFVQAGNHLTVTAAAAASSGDIVAIGSIFGIACDDAEIGDDLVLATGGVYTLAKTAAQAWTVGAPIYLITSTGLLTTASEGNLLVGVAMEVADNPSDTGVVRLNASF